MNLSNRNLAFITLLMLVILRTVIGWHFLYEGATKIDSHRTGLKPWSSRGYLMSSTGPFADEFKSIATPDPFGLELVTPSAIKAGWVEEDGRFADHYSLDAEQARVSSASMEEAIVALDAYFEQEETRQKVMEFRDGVRRWEELAAEDPLTHRKNEMDLLRSEMIDLRNEITAPVSEIEKRYRDHVRSLLTAEQEIEGPVPAPVTTLVVVDWLNMIGITTVGLFLMLGLFSRISALGAAGFLLVFYLAMPPWPGLPAAPIAEGSYMIVNKNLVELVACLVLATVPTGKWLGLDAVVTKLFQGEKGKKVRKK